MRINAPRDDTEYEQIMWAPKRTYQKLRITPQTLNQKVQFTTDDNRKRTVTEPACTVVGLGITSITFGCGWSPDAAAIHYLANIDITIK